MATVKLPDPSTLPHDTSGQSIENAMVSALPSEFQPEQATAKDVVMSDAPPENAPV
jgi:hypothetical protein